MVGAPTGLTRVGPPDRLWGSAVALVAAAARQAGSGRGSGSVRRRAAGERSEGAALEVVLDSKGGRSCSVEASKVGGLAARLGRER